MGPVRRGGGAGGALIPEHVDTHPLGCHNPRISDRVVFDKLIQIALEAYDRIVGLDLQDITVDGCIVKAPGGGEAAGRSPVDRGKQGTKRSVMTDGCGIPIAAVTAGAHRNDSRC